MSKKNLNPPLPETSVATEEIAATELLKKATQRRIDTCTDHLRTTLSHYHCRLQAVVTILDMHITSQVRVVTTDEPPPITATPPQED